MKKLLKINAKVSKRHANENLLGHSINDRARFIKENEAIVKLYKLKEIYTCSAYGRKWN